MNWSIFTKTKKLMTHYAFSINHRGLPVTDSVRQEQSFHNILCETKGKVQTGPFLLNKLLCLLICLFLPSKKNK